MKLKRCKERSEAVEKLQRRTLSGMMHISELLGAAEPNEDTPIVEVVRT